jgi:pyrroline-5-carboxylate reductase
VVLAVKPQILQAVCQEIEPAIKQTRALIISIAAGITESSLANWLGKDTAIVRTMPNTPAMLQSGATVLHGNANTSPEQKDIAESILRAVGITRWLDTEKQIDVATALSGSGPAYYFLFMEAMTRAGIDMGLSEETAHLLTLQTALGAARMAMESNDLPEELRKKVTSPGGTTEAAINHLQHQHFEDIVSQAMQAAKRRSEELSGNRDE